MDVSVLLREQNAYEARFNCPVCLSPRLRMVYGRCQHSICERCLYGGLDTGRDMCRYCLQDCPVCQEPSSFPLLRPSIPEDNVAARVALGMTACPWPKCHEDLWNWELEDHMRDDHQTSLLDQPNLTTGKAQTNRSTPESQATTATPFQPATNTRPTQSAPHQPAQNTLVTQSDPHRPSINTRETESGRQHVEIPLWMVERITDQLEQDPTVSEYFLDMPVPNRQTTQARVSQQHSTQAEVSQRHYTQARVPQQQYTQRTNDAYVMRTRSGRRYARSFPI